MQKNGLFITGTDTDVGKTVAAAWCMLHYGMNYWKPTQSGLQEPTDTQSVQSMTALSNSRFFPETYRLKQPLSPHEAAKRDNLEIDMAAFQCPESKRPILIEGAGGLMVPLNKENFIIDLITQLGFPSILVCRSVLGTINHTLLSLEAMRTRGLDVAGVIINGTKASHNRKAIEEYGGVRVLAEIDYIPVLNAEALLNIKPEFNVMDMMR